MWALIFLPALGMALGSPAERPASRVSSWVSADFDGNRTTDVALSSTVAHDRSGYLQEVRVHLGAALPSFFGFHSRSARIQLGARDVDGDRDLDILVLDGFSMVPIGVWLNDGSGNFSEGDLARYPGTSNAGNSTSLKAPQNAVDRLFALVAPNSQSALPLIRTVAPQPAVKPCGTETAGSDLVRRSVRLRNRAPPRNS
jgi:hypothetical protein